MFNQEPFLITDWQSSFCTGENMEQWGTGTLLVGGKSTPPLRRAILI